MEKLVQGGKVDPGWRSWSRVEELIQGEGAGPGWRSWSRPEWRRLLSFGECPQMNVVAATLQSLSAELEEEEAEPLCLLLLLFLLSFASL